MGDCQCCVVNFGLAIRGDTVRFSTIASFVIAMVLALVATFGARTWLSTERQQITADFQSELSEQLERRAENTLVVASAVMVFGEPITKDKLTEVEWAARLRPEGSYQFIDEIIKGDDPSDARFALGNIAVGEPIFSGRITEPGQRAKLSTALVSGMKAVSIRVNDVLGVAGFVLPSDRVDILLSRGSGDSAYVDVLLQGVKVLAIDQISDEQKDQPSLVRTITLEVNTEQAQKLVLAANVGTLSLALRNLSSTDVDDFDRITFTDLNDSDVAADMLRTLESEAATLEAQLQAEAAIAEAQLQAEAAAAAAQLQTEESEQRVAELEAMLDSISTDLAERIAGVDQSQTVESAQRVAELEAMLNSVSADLAQRIAGVEQTIDDQDDVFVAPQVVEVVKVSRPIIPVRSTVGVIRNGSRVEYSVKSSDSSGDVEPE